jgi:hypothetical protein
LFTFSVQGQSTIPSHQVRSLFKVNALMPGLSYEQKLGQMTSLHFDAYLDFLILSKGETGSSGPMFLPTPAFKTEFRTYYNLANRYEKGKQTTNNSANYFSLLYTGRYSETGDYNTYNRQWVNQAGVVWGIQRNGMSGFSVDINFGLAYTFNSKFYNYYNTIQPVTHLRLGYWLGRKTR